jgi:hypothetical protein
MGWGLQRKEEARTPQSGDLGYRRTMGLLRLRTAEEGRSSRLEAKDTEVIRYVTLMRLPALQGDEF